VIGGLPGQFLDLLVGLRQALSTHVDSSRSVWGTRWLVRAMDWTIGALMRGRVFVPRGP
jgi:hypothetical protein